MTAGASTPHGLCETLESLLLAPVTWHPIQWPLDWSGAALARCHLIILCLPNLLPLALFRPRRRLHRSLVVLGLGPVITAEAIVNFLVYPGPLSLPRILRLFTLGLGPSSTFNGVGIGIGSGFGIGHIVVRRVRRPHCIYSRRPRFHPMLLGGRSSLGGYG